MESGNESTYFLGGSVWIFPPFPNSEPLAKCQKNGRKQSKIYREKAPHHG